VTGGTYTLVLELDRADSIEVGALGEHRFPAGWYAYTGSAFGTGGFARVDRHYELAAGERSTRHWHIDYLLGGRGRLDPRGRQNAGRRHRVCGRERSAVGTDRGLRRVRLFVFLTSRSRD